MAETDPETAASAETPATPEISEPIVVHVPVQATIPSNRPRNVYAGMWGPFEIAAVAIGVLAIFGAIVLYALMVIPSNRELAKNHSEVDRLDAELTSANSKYGDIRDTKTAVSKLVSSVDDFETRFLPIQSVGQPALYQKLNGLIQSYDLTNTTGPDYPPLEAAEQNPGQQTDEEKGRAKFRSLYPGVYITTTLEGSYQNLRRFIRDIETGNEFIVISAIELAPADAEKQKDTGNPEQNGTQLNQPPANTRPAGNTKFSVSGPAGVGPRPGFNQPPVIQQSAKKGKTHGETVSLHIEMAAYFRRPNFVPMSTQ
jgi:hypothetical protein